MILCFCKLKSRSNFFPMIIVIKKQATVDVGGFSVLCFNIRINYMLVIIIFFWIIKSKEEARVDLLRIDEIHSKRLQAYPYGQPCSLFLREFETYYIIATKNIASTKVNNGINVQIARTKNLCFLVQIFALILS